MGVLSAEVSCCPSVFGRRLYTERMRVLACVFKRALNAERQIFSSDAASNSGSEVYNVSGIDVLIFQQNDSHILYISGTAGKNLVHDHVLRSQRSRPVRRRSCKSRCFRSVLRLSGKDLVKN